MKRNAADQLSRALYDFARHATPQAIYLGEDEWREVAQDSRGVAIVFDPDGLKFEGVPLYRVNVKSHFRIV